MRGTPLTPLGAMAELERLLRVHRRPAHAPADAIEFAKDYVEVCRDVSLEQFRQGVTEYLRGPGRFFPKPGEVRALALEQPGAGSVGDVGAFATWLQNGYRATPEGALSACPVCGQDWEWAPRMKIIHRHVTHRALGLPCLGACDELRCLGPGIRSAPVSTVPIDDTAAERAAIQGEGA